MWVDSKKRCWSSVKSNDVIETYDMQGKLVLDSPGFPSLKLLRPFFMGVSGNPKPGPEIGPQLLHLFLRT